jgi:Heavy metal associated domain 2
MLPTGRVMHQMQGRLRFRIADKQRDQMYFDRVRQTLAQCDGVESVTVNPLAGSALVVGTAAAGEVIRFAEQTELFVTVQDRQVPLSDRVSDEVGRLDKRLRAATGGQLDVTTITAGGLLAAALWQTTRRRVLPEALTIAWYVASLMARPLTLRVQQP